VGDLLDVEALDAAIAVWKPDVVFHFAALSVVRDSVADPVRYYRNNVSGTINLLAAMQRNSVDKIVFSSSAAVYGAPCSETIDETHVTSPLNPYGMSKLMIEHVLRDAAKAYGLRSVSLRYFNAAGADAGCEIGESHYPETHLIPNVLAATAAPATLDVFGADYDTEDGTCIRDYVHVTDLADAHLRAAEFLSHNDGCHQFNLGSGAGFSVLEVIQAAQRIVGKSIEFRLALRRPGDPAQLTASYRLARERLGWEPSFSDLETMIASAWSWHCNRAF
jgi:UDP-glucose 4-epimerase